MTTSPARHLSRPLTLRLSPAQHEALTTAAGQAGLPLATLARCLVSFALERLQQGDPAIQRAIRVTRGG